jgi:glycosyltransferase involved in cell wall biosynthesis
MRILLTTETFGTVWSFTRSLCEDLLRRGHEIALVSFGRPPSHEQQAWSATQSKTHGRSFKFVASNAPLEWMGKNEFVFTQGSGVLHHVIRDFVPDLLHSSQFCFGAMALDIPKLITAHTDVFSWLEACRGSKPEPTRWLRQYCALVTHGLNGADAIVSPTRWMASSLKRHYAVLPPSYVIRHGRGLAAASETHLRTMQAVATGRLWDETKNIRMLQDVLAPFPIHVAGERKNHSTVSPRQLGKAILLGALPEASLLSLYARSTIYIDTSVYEPSGLEAAEAAQCGCAVVANDTPATRETWGEAALYFRAPRELSSILQRLNRNSEELAEMQRRSYQRAAELTPQRMADGYEALYEMLCSTNMIAATVAEEDRSFASHAA